MKRGGKRGIIKVAITQKQIQPKEAASLLNRKVIEQRDTTYRIVSKNVSEYHFIVPFDLSEEERVEVGQQERRERLEM